MSLCWSPFRYPFLCLYLSARLQDRMFSSLHPVMDCPCHFAVVSCSLFSCLLIVVWTVCCCSGSWFSSHFGFFLFEVQHLFSCLSFPRLLFYILLRHLSETLCCFVLRFHAVRVSMPTTYLCFVSFQGEYFRTGGFSCPSLCHHAIRAWISLSPLLFRTFSFLTLRLIPFPTQMCVGARPCRLTVSAVWLVSSSPTAFFLLLFLSNCPFCLPFSLGLCTFMSVITMQVRCHIYQLS